MKRLPSEIRPTRRHCTLEEKAEILRSHRSSGLSLLAFARKHDLCYASLLRWRSRQGHQTIAAAASGAEADPRFVPVKIEGEVLGGDYVLSWPEGRSLKIPRQFEPKSLRRLLAVLEEVR